MSSVAFLEAKPAARFTNISEAARYNEALRVLPLTHSLSRGASLAPVCLRQFASQGASVTGFARLIAPVVANDLENSNSESAVAFSGWMP